MYKITEKGARMAKTRTKRSAVRLFIVDADVRYIGKLKTRLSRGNIDLVGQSRSGTGAIDAILELKPDVVVLDLNLPDAMGADLMRDLRDEGFKGEFLVFSKIDDNGRVLQALKAGAMGYVLRTSDVGDELVQAINDVVEGGSPLSPRIARRVLQSINRQPLVSSAPSTMSKREQQILAMLGQGYRPRQISDELDISYQTVRTHQRNIYKKLSATSVNQAVATFFGLGAKGAVAGRA